VFGKGRGRGVLATFSALGSAVPFLSSGNRILAENVNFASILIFFLNERCENINKYKKIKKSKKKMA
jgi:hypothetical protein